MVMFDQIISKLPLYNKMVSFTKFIYGFGFIHAVSISFF